MAAFFAARGTRRPRASRRSAGRQEDAAELLAGARQDDRHVAGFVVARPRTEHRSGNLLVRLTEQVLPHHGFARAVIERLQRGPHAGLDLEPQELQSQLAPPKKDTHGLAPRDLSENDPKMNDPEMRRTSLNDEHEPLAYAADDTYH